MMRPQDYSDLVTLMIEGAVALQHKDERPGFCSLSEPARMASLLYTVLPPAESDKLRNAFWEELFARNIKGAVREAVVAEAQAEAVSA